MLAADDPTGGGAPGFAAGRGRDVPRLVYHPMPDWIKTGASIVLAAGAAYLAIKVDLATTMKDVAYLQATVNRHEAVIEVLRRKPDFSLAK